MSDQHLEYKKAVRKWQILSVVLAAVMLGVFAYSSEHIWKEHMSAGAFMQQYPLIDIARRDISQKIREFVATETDLQYSIYIEFLNNGANIHVNPEGRFWAASLTKLPIAMAIMSAINHGVWSFEDELTLLDEDKNPLSSTLHTLPAGTKIPIKKLLEELLVRSDNTAYLILLRNLPKSEISMMREALGLDLLFDAEGKINAKEYSRFFRSLYTSSYLSLKDSQYLLDLLNHAEFTYFLRQEVPPTIPFPHKFGTQPEGHVYNDSGIVYVPNRPYLITVTVQGDGREGEERRVQEFMNRISAITYAYFSQAK